MRYAAILVPVLLFLNQGMAERLDIDPAELGAFMDGVMNQQLISYDIPGATVAVVKNGKLIYSEGYGYADLESEVPVTPDRTLFRIGSISKIFVWTSVMQLVERGELDLHTDVNRYLEEFSIPDTFEEPITLAHLLTHTPGFEEQELGVFVTDSLSIAPLGRYLAGNMPARVRPPGTLSSYSNYGTALAAYIVQEVSGTPFPQYVRDNIFEPLSMDMSSFLQPPPGMADIVATGYVTGPGMASPQNFEWVQAYPAGSMSSTAEDMSRFMIAHLQNGRYRDRRILEDSTATDMHSLHFTHDPRVNGWTWGFMELDMGRDSIIWHGGDTYYFHSAMYLLPDYDMGIFVSYNCPAGARARIDLLKAFLAHYAPLPRTGPPEPLEGQGHAAECSGPYLDIRSNLTTPERLMTLLNPISVESLDDHTLLFSGNRWVEVEPMAFRNTGSPEMLVFRENAEGSVDAMFRGNNPTTAYLKLSRIESPAFQEGFLKGSLALFISVAVLWPLGFLVQLIGRKRKSGRGARASGTVLWLMCVLNSVFLVRLNGTVPAVGFGFGVPAGLEGLLRLPYLTVLLTVAVTAMTVTAWRKSYWSIAGRIHCSLALIAGILLLLWMNSYNLLFYHFA